jgi:hypothetical protein
MSLSPKSIVYRTQTSPCQERPCTAQRLLFKIGSGRPHDGRDHVAPEMLDGGLHDSGFVLPGHSSYPRRDRRLGKSGGSAPSSGATPRSDNFAQSAVPSPRAAEGSSSLLPSNSNPTTDVFKNVRRVQDQESGCSKKPLRKKVAIVCQDNRLACIKDT